MKTKLYPTLADGYFEANRNEITPARIEFSNRLQPGEAIESHVVTFWKKRGNVFEEADELFGPKQSSVVGGTVVQFWISPPELGTPVKAGWWIVNATVGTSTGKKLVTEHVLLISGKIG